MTLPKTTPPEPTPAPTPEVEGLAPELKSAKKGQGVSPVASAGERFTSYDVEAFEVPGGREENWRFTPLRRLRGLHDGSARLDGSAVIAIAGAGGGVTVERVTLDDARVGEGGVPADRVAAQAWSAAADVTLVTLGGTPDPLTVTVTGPGTGATAAAHLQLRTRPFAEATVVLTHVGSGALADNLEVVVADGSRLTLVVTDEWADDAVHVGAHHLALGRDATLKVISVALGGDAVRRHPAVADAGVVAGDPLDHDALAGSGDLDDRGAVERRGTVVQTAQSAQRGEPPVLLAATGDLERLDVVGREALARRGERLAPLALLGARQLRGEPGDVLDGHPTEPSICSSMRRFSSSAYSMGSSRAMGSTNPRTTIAIASSSVRPRLIR